MVKYKEFNNNPLGKESCDCVVRAISHGLGLTWDEVYDRLVELGKEMKEMPNGDEVYYRFLEEKGYSKETPKVIKGKKRLKVKDMGKGNYILKIANHITTIKDGVLYDTWDCRNKCVYRFWEIKK